MKIFRFDPEVGQHIEMFDSNFIMSKIVMTEKPARIGCMYLQEGGIVGYHEATVPQLFLVMSGEGWVVGKEGIKQRIIQGEAAFWERGEGHETITETGMTAIVIESEELNPSRFLREVRYTGEKTWQQKRTAN